MSGRGLGGGDRRSIEILRRLLKRMEITCIISQMGYYNYRPYISLNYVIIPSIDKLGVLFSYLVRSVVGCFRILREKGDIVYPTSDFLPDVLPAFVYRLKNRNAKWVQIVHHLIPYPSERRGHFLSNLVSYFAQRISFSMIKRFADLIVAVNLSLKSDLEKQGFSRVKIEVNPNGVDVNYFKNLKPITRKMYDAVFLGRLHPSKGIFDLAPIWREVCSEKGNAKLVIIGSGQKKMEYELKEKVRKMNLQPNIEILGYLKDDEAYGIINASRVFILPSYEEGFGIVALEAMACGVPVVAWDLPVYHEVFPKGIVKVPLGNFKKFADEVLMLLNDPELYEKLRGDAISTASKYDWDRVAEREVELMNYWKVYP